MKKITLFTLVFSFLFISGCANYINKMHKEFDRDLGVAQPYKADDRDKFDMYRQNRRRKSSAYPRKKLITSQNSPSLRPMVQRNYVPQEQRKRIKADDLNDNGSDGSLWAQNSKEHPYLFTSDSKKVNGDIVLIKVAGKLKNEITAELKRAFPAPRPKGKAGAAEEAGAEVTKVGETGDEKVYDRISSVVIEEINKDHLLLRGRKNLLYRNKKRLVEVQALITRRDIGMDDTVNSNKIIESAITVLR
ncbi:MAG: flagellar basal body L-ring protein FlgH [Oligoflexia bacterium]|nr:flagellar basal body L-ring protein FlgH [Oligoflexia bacterium]